MVDLPSLPDLRFFYLRGLKAGDKIAAFLPNQGAQYTAWLPIKVVVGDHRAKQRAAETLPRSKHKSNIILDPHGSTQLHPPISEDAWMKAVDSTILKMRSNTIGAQVLGGITRDIKIAPSFRFNKTNSAIAFTPQQWKGDKPGNRADEVLLHELVHILEGGFSGYIDNPTDGLKFDGSDFLTITVTNMYASIDGRPLRADHHDFAPLPFGYRSNVGSFKIAHSGNLASIKTRLPAYARVFAGSSAAWNPFK